ncbi:MAG: CinA family nicotinamide mononucleotide deamidase-related protein [Caldilinea sp.]|nr:CinA family nicotinamide mononucleotide deamidase-related protein [Caldilinea sp.]MDW8441031.1 CinA family nicotinamide mononucleotide deamidase-related protein [Caldilineaceae bacterium]
MPELAAEIITSGTEILLGDIVDTNAVWIAQQLREAGVNLYYKTTVGDNEPRLRGVIELAMTRSDVVIITGGLGPTVDDVTRQAVANATQRSLVLHEGALATLKERFARFGVTMTENNLQQAMIPEGAVLIENPLGTAPGFIVETERCAVIALPGVPREMKAMMTASVLPYLRARMGSGAVIRRRILRTFGIGESAIDARLGELMRRSNPTVGLAAKTGQVDIRIAARADDPETAERMLDAIEAEVRAVVGSYIYSTDPEERYETMLARRMMQAGVTVSLLETNTRGALAERLATALPDRTPLRKHIIASEIASEEVPMELAGAAAPDELDAAAREALARRAATWLRAVSNATLGLALVGTAGAEEGVFGRVPGETWLALDDGERMHTVRIPFGGCDEFTHVRIGNQALIELRRWLDAHNC